MPRFRDMALASGLVDAAQLDAFEQRAVQTLGPNARDDRLRFDKTVAEGLVLGGVLTRFQAEQLLAGHKKLTLGQYRILDELGRGGMGQVFRARHVLMDRIVAVKVLPRAKSTPESEEAFRREIRMLARLVHENLVLALDAGYDGKVFYLVTEFVPGLDLRRQVLKYGRLDEVRATSVICQAASGLCYAHAQGLVHRDTKPANLLVTPDGHVKLLDLGLAGSSLEGESVRLGRVVGTMDYMAPEQIRTPDAVGPLADIYSLGCSFYFALSGEVPFPGGKRHEKAHRHLNEQPRPLRQLRPDLSEGICRVVEAMMQKKPEDRPPSAHAVIERLRPWTPAEPLAMPRGREGVPPVPRDPASEEERSSPRSEAAVSSSLGVPEEVAVEAGQSTRTFWSAFEETDRELDPVSGANGSRRRPRFGRRMLRAVATNIAIAAAISLAFVLLLSFISRIEPDSAGRLFGGGGLRLVGLGTFGLLLAIQFIVATTREAQ